MSTEACIYHHAHKSRIKSVRSIDYYMPDVHWTLHIYFHIKGIVSCNMSKPKHLVKNVLQKLLKKKKKKKVVTFFSWKTEGELDPTSSALWMHHTFFSWKTEGELDPTSSALWVQQVETNCNKSERIQASITGATLCHWSWMWWKQVKLYHREAKYLL